MTGRRAAAWPVAVAVAIHALVTASWPLALILGGGLVAAVLFSLRVSRLPQILLHAVGAGLGSWAALAVGPFSEALPAAARAISGGALGAAVVGLLCRLTIGAPLSPPFFALASLVACGMTRSGVLYVAGVLMFVATVLRAFGAEAHGGPRLRDLDRARAASSLAGAATGVALALSLILLLPPAEAVARRWVMQSPLSPAVSGLSDGIRLSRTTNIETSDEIVLRVRGPAPDLLRGFVHTQYRNGRWTRAVAPRIRAVHGLAARPPPGLRVSLTPVTTAEQYLIPLQASAVWLAADHAVVDQYGQWRAPRGELAAASSFGLDGEQPVEAPGPPDTAVPPDVAAALADLARAWAPPGPPAQRLASLVAHLRDGFTYSLHTQRRTNGDPVVDFLLHERRGHCEFFASALALLARVSGIPARIVTGYRVHEQNRFGGYRVVRERDAHAWVEAFLDGRWTTHDPTPPSFLEEEAARTPLLAALADWIGARWAESDPATALRPVAALAIPLLGGWLAIRLVRRRRERERAASAVQGSDLPWPAADELLRSLARRGWPRQPWESLEAYCRRLRAAAPVAPCAQSLDAYARHRYGGVAPRLEVEAQLAQALRLLRHDR
jgi:transglutaminase-like putative cysteine protease